MGINPNIIVLRCDEPLEDSIKNKISMFCNVKPDCVIENITLPNLYEAPLMLEEANFSSIVCRELSLKTAPCDLKEWTALVEKIKSRKKEVRIGLVGKYVQLHDAYLSVAEALQHAGYQCGTYVKIEWIDSEKLTEQTVEEELGSLQGIIVPRRIWKPWYKKAIELSLIIIFLKLYKLIFMKHLINTFLVLCLFLVSCSQNSG